jgi:hypothetical protein
MKLDIFDNSLRLFVNTSELDDLRRGMACRLSSLEASSSKIRAGLRTKGAITASFSGWAIRIGVPANDLASFASRGRLALSAEILYSQARPLRVVIERDLGSEALFGSSDLSRHITK